MVGLDRRDDVVKLRLQGGKERDARSRGLTSPSKTSSPTHRHRVESRSTAFTAPGMVSLLGHFIASYMEHGSSTSFLVMTLSSPTRPRVAS